MSLIRITAAVAAGLALAACGRQDAKVDPAQIDAGAPRNPPGAGAAQQTLTLPGEATVKTTPSVVGIDTYLRSDAPAGQRFELSAISFVKGAEVREDPDGALATLAAVLNAYPASRVRIEVAMDNPEAAAPNPAAKMRADQVAKALVRNGLSASRVTSAGVQAPEPGPPKVALVVTRK